MEEGWRRDGGGMEEGWRKAEATILQVLRKIGDSPIWFLAVFSWNRYFGPSGSRPKVFPIVAGGKAKRRPR
jgi:hypothetical protein